MKPILHAILFSGVYLSAQALFAQNVGIGTSTPNASAKLEIVDANRGFLFPRVSLTATNVAAPVTAPANWLVVFNVATAGAGATAVSPGLYYWDNTLLRWVRIQNETDAWRTLGNAGTSPATNFIGTTDAQDFVFRTSNTERMRLNSAGRLVMNATIARARLHVEENFLGNFTNAPLPGIIVNNGDDMVGMTVADRDGVSGGDDSDGMIYWGDNLGTDNLHFSFLEWGGGVLTRRDRMIIQSTGNVGIGTTAPLHQLDINPATSPIWTSNSWRGLVGLSDAGAIGWRNSVGGLSAGIGHTSNGTASLNDDALCFFTTNSALATNGSPANYAMRIFDTNNQIAINNGSAGIPDASAQVEIASTSRGLLIPRVALTQTTNISPVAVTPTTSLIVYNTATINDVSPGFYYWNGANWVRFQTSNTNDWTLLGNAGTNPATNFIGTTDAQPLVVRTSNAERMRVTGGGFVGIGTNAPATTLHTVGRTRLEQNDATLQLVGATAGHSYIEYYPFGIASGRQGYIGYPSNGSTSFNFYNENATGDVNFGVGGTAASVDMTVKNNGFVGIATTAPNQKLTVEAGNIEIGNNNDNMLVSRNNAQGLNHQMIGTYMGWDTRGVYLAGYNQNNLGGAGTYNATNRIYAGGSFGSLPISATAFTVVSAKRYKQNILPVAYGLSSILNLNPVQYQYTFEQEKSTHVGFIAEEVEKVIPEIVVKQTNPETANYGQAMGVNYTELVPVLVKGMQEQQSEIETLKKQNARLEAELQEIKKMLLEKK